MAIAGGATTAYYVKLAGDSLDITPTTALRSICAEVDEALARLGEGETVMVSGWDMPLLRRRLFEQAESAHAPADWVVL